MIKEELEPGKYVVIKAFRSNEKSGIYEGEVVSLLKVNQNKVIFHRDSFHEELEREVGRSVARMNNTARLEVFKDSTSPKEEADRNFLNGLIDESVEESDIRPKTEWILTRKIHPCWVENGMPGELAPSLTPSRDSSFSVRLRIRRVDGSFVYFECELSHNFWSHEQCVETEIFQKSVMSKADYDRKFLNGLIDESVKKKKFFVEFLFIAKLVDSAEMVYFDYGETVTVTKEEGEQTYFLASWATVNGHVEFEHVVPTKIFNRCTVPLDEYNRKFLNNLHDDDDIFESEEFQPGTLWIFTKTVKLRVENDHGDLKKGVDYFIPAGKDLAFVFRIRKIEDDRIYVDFIKVGSEDGETSVGTDSRHSLPLIDFKDKAIPYTSYSDYRKIFDKKFFQGLHADDDLDESVILENVPPPGKKRVAVVIGRFNPPTKGHYELINKVAKFIKNNPNLQLDAVPVVVVIGNDKKQKTAEEMMRNPLSVHDRITFMQSSGNANGVKFISATNAFEALTKVRQEGLEPIAIAAGTDRIDDYIKILDKYFKTADGKQIAHAKIHLPRDEGAIETKKATKSDNIDDTLASMKDGEELTTDIVSGSLARRAVELGYFEEFAKIVGLEQNQKLAQLLFNKVKKVFDTAKQSTEGKTE